MALGVQGERRERTVASKRAERRRQCGHKERLHQAEAERVARRLSAQDGAWMTPYHCPHCGAWHVGHAPYWVRQSLIDRQRAQQAQQQADARRWA